MYKTILSGVIAMLIIGAVVGIIKFISATNDIESEWGIFSIACVILAAIATIIDHTKFSKS